MWILHGLGVAAWTALVAARCGGAPSTTADGATELPPAAAATPAATAPRGAGADVPPIPTPQPAAMRPLAASAHLYTAQASAMSEAGVTVLRDRAAWEFAWRELQNGRPAGAAPAVDFAREMVVMVAGGEKPSAGHAVRVDGTRLLAGGVLELHATATAPGAGCMSAMMITAPVDVVRVPRSAGEVRVAWRRVAAPC